MTYYTDGYTLKYNPSPIGGGYTVFKGGELLETKEVLKKCFTNNEAELLGVNAAIKVANYEDVIITDSMNTIRWLNSGKSKSRPDLVGIIRETKDLIDEKKIKLNWEPRDFNPAGIYNERFEYWLYHSKRQSVYQN